jgi:hypothetical protein
MKKIFPVLVILVMTSLSAQAELIGWYTFDDPNNLAKDSSGFGKNGTILDNGNAPTFANGAGLNGGGAAQFNGGGIISIPFNTGPSLFPDLTWGAWIKPAQTDGVRDIFNNDDGGFDRCLNIDTRVLGNYGAFNGSGVYSTGIAPSTSDWTFMAGVYENNFYGSGNGKLTLYIGNTVIDNIHTSFGDTMWTFTALGGSPTFGEYFKGVMDNAFIFNDALNSSQISDLQTNGPGDVTGLTHIVPADYSVPEPSTYALFGIGAIGMLLVMRRKKTA